jgi:hypothetical protein
MSDDGWEEFVKRSWSEREPKKERKGKKKTKREREREKRRRDEKGDGTHPGFKGQTPLKKSGFIEFQLI